MPKSLAEQKRDKCVHFTGIMNDECAAGVNYESVRVDGCGLPCLRGDSRISGGDNLPCDKRHWPTEEEVQAMVDESNRRMKIALSGVAAVVEDAAKRGLGKRNGGRGEVDCPVCDGGTIHYSVSGFNGHRHAKCTTADCVSFME